LCDRSGRRRATKGVPMWWSRAVCLVAVAWSACGGDGRAPAPPPTAAAPDAGAPAAAGPDGATAADAPSPTPPPASTPPAVPAPPPAPSFDAPVADGGAADVVLD